MFSKVFLICALAAAASAYQIGSYYQGVQTPEERYGYQYYLRLIGAGYPYYQGYKQYYPYNYASRYYNPAVGQEDIVEPQEQEVYYQRYYPQYLSGLLRYPYFSRYFQQYYNQPGYVTPLSYERQYQYEQDTPYYGQQYYNRVPYQQYGQLYGRGYDYSQYQYPYQQGRYYSSLLNRILGYQQYQPEYVY